MAVPMIKFWHSHSQVLIKHLLCAVFQGARGKGCSGKHERMHDHTSFLIVKEKCIRIEKHTNKYDFHWTINAIKMIKRG